MTREIVSHHTTEFQVQIAGSAITGTKAIDITKTGLRIYDGGKMGIAGATGEALLGELEAKARDALGHGVPYPYPPSTSLKQTKSHDFETMTDGDFTAKCEKLLASLRSECPHLIFSHILKMVRVEQSIQNDQGLDLAFRDGYFDLTLIYKKRGSPGIADGHLSLISRQDSFEELLGEAREHATAFETVVDLPAGEHLPIIWFERDDTPLSLFSRELYPSRFGTGSSLFSGKVGSQIASENFSLAHDRSAELRPGLAFFDAEGVVNPSFECPLIESGVLRQPYTDKRTAAEYGLALSGSAAGEYDSAPTQARLLPRLRQTHQTLSSILGGDKGVLVIFGAGGSFDTAGRFGSPLQTAFLHDGQRILGKLPELEVSGNMDSLFGKGFRGVCHQGSHPRALGGFIVSDLHVRKI